MLMAELPLVKHNSAPQPGIGDHEKPSLLIQTSKTKTKDIWDGNHKYSEVGAGQDNPASVSPVEISIEL